MLFKEALNEYLQLSKADLKDDDYRYFKDKLDLLVPYIGNYNVERMKPNGITNFIIRLKEDHPKIKTSEINKYIQEIKNILRTVCGYNFGYRKLKDPKHIYMLSKQEKNQIYNYFQSTRNDPDLLGDEILFRILIETGIRINELVDLKTSTFIMTNNGITVSRNSTLYKQLSYLSDETLTLLSSYLSKENDYLFTCTSDGEKYTTYLVLDVIKSIAEEINLKKKLTAKLIRNTFMGNFLESGGSIHDLKDLMGYSTYKNLAELIPLWKPKKK